MLMIGWTTVETLAQAETLARQSVDHNLAACVQIDGPITSIYRWEGAVEHSREYRLTFKFAAANSECLREFVLSTHPYTTPEWAAVRVTEVGEKYLSWVQANSTSAPL